jgi:hypothetical protein
MMSISSRNLSNSSFSLFFGDMATRSVSIINKSQTNETRRKHINAHCAGNGVVGTRDKTAYSYSTSMLVVLYARPDRTHHLFINMKKCRSWGWYSGKLPNNYPIRVRHFRFLNYMARGTLTSSNWTWRFKTCKVYTRKMCNIFQHWMLRLDFVWAQSLGPNIYLGTQRLESWDGPGSICRCNVPGIVPDWEITINCGIWNWLGINFQ